MATKIEGAYGQIFHEVGRVTLQQPADLAPLKTAVRALMLAVHVDACQATVCEEFDVRAEDMSVITGCGDTLKSGEVYLCDKAKALGEES